MEFMAKVEAFLERTGMGQAALGRAVCGDPSIVAELRRGRSPTLKTVARFEEFMADYGSKEPEILTFGLPYALPTLNPMLRESPHSYARRRRALATEVMALLSGRRPKSPWPRAKVTVTRCSIGQPDRDNLTSCVKALLDVLQPQSARCPDGLGVIASDSSLALELDVIAQHVTSRSEIRTMVEIVRLPDRAWAAHDAQ